MNERNQIKRKIAVFLLALGVWELWYVHLQTQHTGLSRPLLEAVRAGDEDKVKSLLDRGADPNAVIVVNDSRPLWRQLIDSLQHKEPESVIGPPLLLLLFPAPVPEPATREQIPDEYPRIISALLQHGANPNIRDRDGMPILCGAYSNGKRQMLQLLLVNKVDTNARCADGKTALSLAAADAMPYYIQSLLVMGADVNVQDNEGCTPLMWVIRKYGDKWPSDRVEAVRMLIRSGADVNRRDKTGKTALGWTDVSHAPKLADILKKAGATK